MFVKVVAHDPQWERIFQTEAEALRHTLGSELIAVFHIGSTAVPGLWAKPIIDMLPVVESLDARAPRRGRGGGSWRFAIA